MCYDITYLTKRQIDYAKRYGAEEDVEDIKKRLPAVYHTSGFDHPKVPVVSSENSKRIQLYEWGLVPFWTKSGDQFSISNKTLNARGETLFEKKSFKQSARKNRCLVLVDGFFEHHHIKGKAIPHLIRRKDGQPFSLGGIWDKWEDLKSGEKKSTFSIVTTVANNRMATIHNNPKVLARGGPRMPFILDKDQEKFWLDPDLSEKDITSLISTYPHDELEDYPVKALRGKNAVGNSPKAHEKEDYPELNQLSMGF